MIAAREASRIPCARNDAARDVTTLVANAMRAARLAQTHWVSTSMVERIGMVRELRNLIAGHSHQLAEASAAARSRPMVESLSAEVFPLAEACRFLEREAEKILTPRRIGKRGVPLWLAGIRSEIRREPFGIVLIIGPGNYPLLLPGIQLIHAIVAGNGVLLKPGVGGTAAARALNGLIVRAGFDPQLVAVLPEASEAARTAIAARPDKVLFTGSAGTGEKILAQLAPHLIPATMELSGCDAVIVRADADPCLVVKALVFGLRLNAGATCMAPRRVFVARSIAAEIEGRLAHALGNHQGDEAPPSTKGQSRVSSAEAERLRLLLDDALARGAHFVTGEIYRDGSITTPLVLAGVSYSARLIREDVFAPVLAIVTVADDDEAIRLTNDCPFALTASIFSRDEAAARSLATRINAGVVTINDLIIPTADARLPFGGRERSGFGVTRGAEGLLELTRPKVVTISRGKLRPAFDSTQPNDARIFQAYLTLTHGRGLKSRGAAMIALLGSIASRKKSFQKDTP